MKRYLFQVVANVVIYFICQFIGLFAVAIVAHAQDEPKICISQTNANKCASAAAELIEARKVINDYMVLDAKSLAERAKAATVISGLNELVVVKDRIIASYEQINALYKSVIDLQQNIILKLEERLNKPKSSWQKLMSTLGKAVILLAGITLGRGF